MKHVEIGSDSSLRRDLARRLTGRYYTPAPVAGQLAASALAQGTAPRVVGDPFAGDGRLLVAWLRAASRHRPQALQHLVEVRLWDWDAAAVPRARDAVRQALCEAGRASCRIDAWAGDSFPRLDAARGTCDLVLTNPPWELLKPDARDGIAAIDDYKDRLRDYAAWLAATWPGARSARGKAMTGYGVNLARAGALAAAGMLTPAGVLGIVLPASIFGDQASTPFRAGFFTALQVLSMQWFPAEARLFADVDQPVVSVLARAGGPTSALVLERHHADLALRDRRTVQRAADPGAPLAFAVDGPQEDVLATLAVTHPMLSSLEDDERVGLWLGRELDETRLHEAQVPAGRGVPFLKGRHVFPFRVVLDEPLYIDPRRRVIPRTVVESRLAWRDVSRPTQRRRMHVAPVPRGMVTGNSLGVAFFRVRPRSRVRVLLGVMNSLVFELQVRSLLSTAHVSQGVLRRCRVPAALFAGNREDAGFLRVVQRCLRDGAARPELEVQVARSYGVTREDFATVLGAFPKLEDPARQALLAGALWGRGVNALRATSRRR